MEDKQIFNVDIAFMIDIQCGLTFAEIAQVVERRPEKPGVPSASLGLGTIFPQSFLLEKNGAVLFPTK